MLGPCAKQSRLVFTAKGEPQTIVFLYDLGTNHADVAHAALHTPI